MTSEERSTDRMPGRRETPFAGATSTPETGPLTAEEFAERFRAASRVLWTVAAGVLGDPSEAEDVLQESCMMALEKLDHYERGTNFTGWMASFVRNVARNDARKRQRRRTTPTDIEVLHAVQGNGHVPQPPVDREGLIESDQTAFDDEVVEALGTLGSTQRACLLLRTVHDLTYREIGAVLKIPEGTAMSHVSRARASLRTLLSGASTRSSEERKHD